MTQKKYRQDAICALVFMALCVFMAFVGIPKEISLQTLWGGSSAGVNSRIFPYFAVAIIFAASLIQFITSTVGYVKRRKAEGKEASEGVNWQGEIRSLLVFACCLIYMFLFRAVGYLIATLIAPALVLVVLKDFNWKHYLSVYVVGGIMYAIFQFLLKIILP